MKRPTLRKLARRPEGFTIVELMIATLVFSMILLIIMTGVIQVTRTYYKGITENNTQTTARTIMDTVSQAIQFNGGIVSNTPAYQSGTPLVTCVGGQQFIYMLGKELVDGTNNHVIYQSNSAGCSAGSGSFSGASGGRELMSPHMRLSNFSVTNIAGTNSYAIDVKVVYGDDDLLNDPTGTDASCEGVTAGTQFCAVSELSTVVTKRVQ